MANAVVAGRSECVGERTDHQLVSAVRAGDDRAFEQLYSRYQRRIAAYVCGMVKDYGRAEDITQEVFVSALRRMRQTERPIAFKPWIYEIAKNACIDAYRRQRRTEEVSYDADDRLSASDHMRLVATGPEPDAAVDTKLELDSLCGAFGGLSDSHHEILVLRELEGRSYKDIGARMGMSRPAVESTLFRARKRLGEEYDELASGARCLRIQAIIARGGRVGRRDGQKLARHLSHCQPCRRLAAGAGIEVPVPVRRRIAEKVAGLLPFPIFLRFRRGGDGAATALGGGNGWMANAPTFAEAMNSGWSKGAAGIAALVLAGAGVSTITDSNKRDERGTGFHEAVAPAPARDGGGGERSAPARGADATVRSRAAGNRERAAKRSKGRAVRGGADRGVADAGARGADKGAAGGSPASAGSTQGSGGSSGGGAGPVAAGQAPALEAPAAPAVAPEVEVPSVQETAESVTGALPDVNEPVQAVAPDAPALPDPAEVTAPVTEGADEVVGSLPVP